MKAFRLLRRYLRGQSGPLAWALVFGFLAVGTRLAIPLLVGLAVNAIVAGGSLAGIALYLGLMGVFLVLGTGFRYGYDYLTARISEKAIMALRQTIEKASLNAPLAEVDVMAEGDYRQRLLGGVETVKNGLLTGGVVLYEGALSILFTLAYMAYLNWALALIVVILTPLSLLASRRLAQANASHFRGQSAATGALTGFASESVSSSVTVASYGLMGEREKGFAGRNETLRQEGFKAALGAGLINPTTRLVNNLINVVVLITGAAFIITKVGGSLALGIGSLAAFLAYASNYTQPFNEVADVAGEMGAAEAALERAEAVASWPVDSDPGTALIAGPVREIQAQGLSFAYEPGSLIIKGVSFTLKRGERIALVGPTGSGKTTLVNLLLRFYDPQGGVLTANGVPFPALEKGAYRSHVGMVLQDTWIRHGTVAENIAYAQPNASRAEIEAAAKEAMADGFIARLPQGYDTPLDGSSGLSEGERQLIALARVLLLRPEIVILDEATSALDARTEALLSQGVARLLEGRTALIVAHRLTTIAHSDLIRVLKDGAIIEAGKHEELMAENGFYRCLYDAQFD